MLTDEEKAAARGAAVKRYMWDKGTPHRVVAELRGIRFTKNDLPYLADCPKANAVGNDLAKWLGWTGDYDDSGGAWVNRSIAEKQCRLEVAQ